MTIRGNKLRIDQERILPNGRDENKTRFFASDGGGALGVVVRSE